MQIYKTEGIIIKNRDFGEADRILSIYTKKFGKIRIVAKGVRRVHSRRCGSLEIFNYASLTLSEGKDLDYLGEVDLLESFPNLRKDLKKIGLAYYMCELIDSLCPEKQENSEIFVLFYSLLKRLDQIEKQDNHYSIKKFTIELLQLTGYLEKEKDYQKTNIKNFVEEIIQKKIKSDRILKLLA